MGELALRELVDTTTLVEVTRELVRCRSVNPPGDERSAAQVVIRHLERIGAREIRTFEPSSGRVSVLAKWGRPGRRALGWNGHLDVVPVGDEAQWQHPPFDAHVAEGRVWGRGTADMKGAIASVLQALELIGRRGTEPDGEVVLSFVADEETGGTLGTSYLADQGLIRGLDAAICGEPTGLNVATAARGRLWLEIIADGRSSHASQPEGGDNAITRMHRVVAALMEVDLPREAHPLLGRATLTPTRIAGGDSPNSVPDRCALTIDRRFLPTEDAEGVRQQIEQALDALAGDRHHLQIIEHAHFEASEIDPTEPLVATVRTAAARAVGRRPQVTGMPGSTDARFLVRAGVPTVIFGPGDLSRAHSLDESIGISELVDGAAAYAAVIEDFLA